MSDCWPRTRPPYSVLQVEPLRLQRVLEESGLRTSDRAMLLAAICSASPRDNTTRLSAVELRRLAGEPSGKKNGGGWMSGSLKRLQALGLVAKVPHNAGGPGWMVSPLVVDTWGSPSQVRQRWRRFRALLTEAQQREQLKALAEIEQAEQQQGADPVAAAA